MRTPRKRRIAAPDDLDLTMRLIGVVLSPPVVLARDLHMEYTAEAGSAMVDDADMPQISDDPFAGTFTACYPYSQATEDQFVWVVSQFDRWAVDKTPLVFVAAQRRLSAFYAPDGLMVPFVGV